MKEVQLSRSLDIANSADKTSTVHSSDVTWLDEL